MASWWKFIVNMLYRNKCDKSGLNDLKLMILAWKTTNVLGGHFEDKELEALFDEEYR